MSKRLVCLLAFDRMNLFEMGVASEIFGLPRPEYDNWYEFKIVAETDQPLRSMGGLKLQTDNDLNLLQQAHLIIIPGWKAEKNSVSPRLQEALIKAKINGAKLISICSGVFLLAACGFLKDKKATTHWHYADKLAQLYPEIQVDEKVLYIDEGQIMTSAGSAAGIDLCLHVIRQDHGSEIANEVARRLVLPAYREGGQAQYIARPLPKQRGGKIAPLLDEIRANLDQDWPNEEMAAKAGLTTRTLLRRFQETIGETPQSWLISERLRRCQELLETSRLSIAEIAESTGFMTAETLRHHFRKKLGISPSQYRMGFAQRQKQVA